ncbi:MAG: hypothetical protein FWG90_13885 [Oscillospiraceae bacterium]|nr:hypothetical protein [Oscillospiraceae bacterium]
MSEYQTMYLKLFNQITDSIKVLESELIKLKAVQSQTEEMFINADTKNNALISQSVGGC